MKYPVKNGKKAANGQKLLIKFNKFFNVQFVYKISFLLIKIKILEH